MNPETVPTRPLPLLDLTIAIGAAAATAGSRSLRRVGTVLAPVAPVARRLTPRPFVVDSRYWPETALRRMAELGREQRVAVERAVVEVVRALIPRVLDAALDEVDLTALVIERVDLDAVAAHLDLDAAAGRVDVDAILDRVDLIALARYIIDGVDLPEIIRDSTGSMASEGIRGVRIQTIDADERVNRLVDRMLLRRQARRTEVSGTNSSETDGHGGS